jgi:hypothetical protein
MARVAAARPVWLRRGQFRRTARVRIFGLIRHRCRCGEHSLVLLGDVTASLLRATLDVATSLGARPALMESDEVVCPSCGYASEKNPVLRVLTCLTGPDARLDRNGDARGPAPPRMAARQRGRQT